MDFSKCRERIPKTGIAVDGKGEWFSFSG